MKVIPAIDIMEGKCVRLEQGSFLSKKSYHEDPVEVAMKFESFGFPKLHLVDLDGAREKRVVNHRILEKIAHKTGLEIEVGGGIASDDDLRICFDCGAAQIIGGSIAVKKKALFLSWLDKYGADKVLLGADAKDEKIMISGWEEETKIFLVDFLEEFRERGLETAIVTDIAKDGLLAGPSLDLYRKIRDECPALKLVASGGVSSMDDLHALRETGVVGVIVGKAIYEGRILLNDLKAMLP